MRISDWSSDVCSSDLAIVAQEGRIDRGEAAQQVEYAGHLALQPEALQLFGLQVAHQVGPEADRDPGFARPLDGDLVLVEHLGEIGRASCRERVCPYE